MSSFNITPAPEPFSKYTWVNEWYDPEDRVISKLVGNKQVKGWHKVAAIGKEPISNTNCVLDLNRMKFYEEVPIVDHSVKQESEKPETTDISGAFSLKEDEGQISSL